MDSYTINAYPLHIRHKCRPNTPDEAVAAFNRNEGWIVCKHYGGMTPKACKDRKARSKLAKRIVVHHYQRCTMASDEYQRLSHCVKCRRKP